ncbi:hypothetical protein H4I96_10120 [Botrytis cinerea]
MMNHASTPPKLTPPYTECSAQKTERRAAEGIEREHHIIEQLSLGTSSVVSKQANSKGSRTGKTSFKWF